MKFVDKLLQFLSDAIKFIGDAIMSIIDLLAKPLSYLLEFLIGIFYFIFKLFDVVVQVIMIFVALFQFLFAVASGLFRTAKSWLTVNPDPADVSFPSKTYQGFQVVTDLLQPTGIMTIVPLVALAFLWLYFIIKIIGLFGGTIMVRPFGNSGGN